MRRIIRLLKISGIYFDEPELELHPPAPPQPLSAPLLLDVVCLASEEASELAECVEVGCALEPDAEEASVDAGADGAGGLGLDVVSSAYTAPLKRAAEKTPAEIRT